MGQVSDPRAVTGLPTAIVPGDTAECPSGHVGIGRWRAVAAEFQWTSVEWLCWSFMCSHSQASAVCPNASVDVVVKVFLP